jgi:hypothetical protein
VSQDLALHTMLSDAGRYRQTDPWQGVLSVMAWLHQLSIHCFGKPTLNKETKLRVARCSGAIC